MATAKFKDLVPGTIKDDTIIPCSIDGNTRGTTVKELRNMATDLDDEDVGKSASNTNLKNLSDKVNGLIVDGGEF
mgnify:CR=1 FL=1